MKLGIGHTQLTEFAAFIDVPSLSCSGYVQIQSNAAKAISEVAWDEIKKAGEEERKLAIQHGDIDIDGVPMITVVADGQWSKRSYKTKYDALSGVVNIIIIYFLIIYYTIIDILIFLFKSLPITYICFKLCYL